MRVILSADYDLLVTQASCDGSCLHQVGGFGSGGGCASLWDLCEVDGEAPLVPVSQSMVSVEHDTGRLQVMLGSRDLAGGVHMDANFDTLCYETGDDVDDRIRLAGTLAPEGRLIAVGSIQGVGTN